jgi:mRNA interferase RelE/StbE
MSYEIIISKSVEKEIADLPKFAFKRIDRIILSLEENPRPAGCLKLTNHSNLYRIRVGHFRIVYLIYDENKIVDIRQVDHRKDIYKKKK